MINLWVAWGICWVLVIILYFILCFDFRRVKGQFILYQEQFIGLMGDFGAWFVFNIIRVVFFIKFINPFHKRIDNEMWNIILEMIASKDEGNKYLAFVILYASRLSRNQRKFIMQSEYDENGEITEDCLFYQFCKYIIYQ